MARGERWLTAAHPRTLVNATWGEIEMNRSTKLALVAFPLAAAMISGPAAAAVFKSVGSDTSFSAWGSLPAGPGKYRFEMQSSIPVTTQFMAGYQRHWDVFLAPPPKPHSEYIKGNDSEFVFDETQAGLKSVWTIVIPHTEYYFFNSDEGYEGYGIPVGVPLYEQVKFEEGWFEVYAQAAEGAPFKYYFTISSIPEPATWAMMIIGFGMVGSSVRGSRRQPMQA